MFYAEYPDNTLRFGDVVKGYVFSRADIREPVLSSTQNHNYKVNVEIPLYSVILTPCCSIEDGMITLTPLVKILSNFLKNSYFEEDLTRINREMEPKQTVPVDTWESFTLEEKEKRLSEGKTHSLVQYFIYEADDRFVKYPLRGKDIGYYMIDFRNIYTIKCDLIKRVCGGSSAEDQLLKSKCLQLTNDIRSELRVKIASYYSRKPIEDSVLED